MSAQSQLDSLYLPHSLFSLFYLSYNFKIWNQTRCPCMFVVFRWRLITGVDIPRAIQCAYGSWYSNRSSILNTYPGVECWPGSQKMALIFFEMLCSNLLKAFYFLLEYSPAFAVAWAKIEIAVYLSAPLWLCLQRILRKTTEYFPGLTYRKMCPGLYIPGVSNDGFIKQGPGIKCGLRTTLVKTVLPSLHWGIQGGVPGGPPPLIFRPNLSPLSQDLDDRSPPVIRRSGSATELFKAKYDQKIAK